jgi:hypothetical protein
MRVSNSNRANRWRSEPILRDDIGAKSRRIAPAMHLRLH